MMRAMALDAGARAAKGSLSASGDWAGRRVPVACGIWRKRCAGPSPSAGMTRRNSRLVRRPGAGGTVDSGALRRLRGG